jgi:hypothetical protein
VKGLRESRIGSACIGLAVDGSVGGVRCHAYFSSLRWGPVTPTSGDLSWQALSSSAMPSPALSPTCRVLDLSAVHRLECAALSTLNCSGIPPRLLPGRCDVPSSPATVFFSRNRLTRSGHAGEYETPMAKYVVLLYPMPCGRAGGEFCRLPATNFPHLVDLLEG